MADYSAAPPQASGLDRTDLRRAYRQDEESCIAERLVQAAVEKLAETAHASLEKIGLSGGDVDWIVPHQANIRIIEGTAKKMQVSMDKVIVTVQDHGNTSAASIPLALSVGKARGQIKEGDLIVTEAIGGGLAWGAVVLRW